ncbi:Threonine/homoserine efflux transporter RhtA [Hyphomicrobiales bacterium]|nr:Threonine/homoserine efflux transporter RhtA [Hyphomicrobiales bacterium]CAH1680875.1 Threonine/homoserine efflux transporter RhtA [Hyphomicrobiales bacterium]
MSTLSAPTEKPLPEASPRTDTASPHLSAPVKDTSLRGILMFSLALILFSIGDGTSKYLTETLPPFQISWMRFGVFAAIVLLIAALRRDWSAFRSRCPHIQLVRGIGIAGSTVLFVTAMSFLPIAEATSISFVSPLLVTALAIPILGEKVGWRRWAAIIVGFIGVVIVVRPGSGHLGLAALLPLSSATCWAIALIATRMTSGRDGALTALIYASCLGFALTTLLLPFGWVQPSLIELLWVGVIGVSTVCAQFLVIAAFHAARVSTLAPIAYTQLLWSGLIGYFVFHQMPDQWAILGAVVIMLSGLYTASRERRRYAV